MYWREKENTHQIYDIKSTFYSTRKQSLSIFSLETKKKKELHMYYNEMKQQRQRIYILLKKKSVIMVETYMQFH